MLSSTDSVSSTVLLSALDKSQGKLLSNLQKLSPDTDYAKVTSNMSQANIQQRSSLKAVALYNAIQKNVLGLISS